MRGVRNIGGLVWVAPLGILFGVWLWYVFNSGGFLPRQWLAGALAVAFFGLVVAILSAYPRRPRGTALIIIGLFAAYAVWIGASAFWADSASRVWIETARVFFLLIVLTLALIYLGEHAVRKAFPLLLLAAFLVLLAASVWRLWTAPDIDRLFIESRWAWPIDYPNNNAALYLIGFWPLIWLAATSAHGLLARGVALATATGVLGFFVMTQSRGALWALALSTVIMFVISPIRLRTFLYLLIPALLTVFYQFPTLNRLWSEGVTDAPRGGAAATILTASVIGGVCCVAFALVERRLYTRAWLKVAGGTAVLLIVLGASIWGTASLTRDVGGPFAWIDQAWFQFTGQAGESDAPPENEASSRFLVVSSSGRVDIWRVAWEAFLEKPLTGVGADNFVFRYDQFRQRDADSQHAHSLELQLLGETGAIGGLLALLGISVGLFTLLHRRTREGIRGARRSLARIYGRLKRQDRQPRAPAALASQGSTAVYAWEMAVVAALSYWMIHASVDWLWQMVGIAIPALLLFAAVVAAAQNRGGRGSHAETESLREESPPSTGVPSRPSSATFRVVLAFAGIVVMVMAGLSYSSLKMQESALALANTDRARAASRAEAAHVLQPTDPQPYVTQASIYFAGANVAGEVDGVARAAAALDNLALSIHSMAKACDLEPANWSLWYQKGVETLNLLLVRLELAGELPADWDYAQAMALIPGLADWSWVDTSLASELPLPGHSAYSLAASPPAVDAATRYRNESSGALAEMIARDLRNAAERNPRASQVETATLLSESLAGVNAFGRATANMR